MAVGSAGLAEEVSVEAPVRTCTDGQSKSAGNSVVAATDALALEAGELNHEGMDSEGIEGSAEQPAKAGASKAKAAVRPRHGTRKSDKLTHPNLATHPPLTNA
jgi:hypothetical protein